MNVKGQSHLLIAVTGLVIAIGIFFFNFLIMNVTLDVGTAQIKKEYQGYESLVYSYYFTSEDRKFVIEQESFETLVGNGCSLSIGDQTVRKVYFKSTSNGNCNKYPSPHPRITSWNGSEIVEIFAVVAG